ncbi:MAG TPA: hypothetical protein VFH47_07160 [Candidatus Thermoplasmatota archaeon]|nr:hypothetical protein [Candidatus Thermoplasmatota archaeon]
MQLSAAHVGVGVVAGMTVFTLLATAMEVPSLWNPCTTWDMDGEGPHRLGDNEGCTAETGRSETRVEAALRLLSVNLAVAAPGVAALRALRTRSVAWMSVAAALEAGAVVLFAWGFALLHFAAAAVAGVLFSSTTLGWWFRRMAATRQESQCKG